MFRDPRLHLGTGLLSGQRAGLHLCPECLALLAELPGEFLLLRRGVGSRARAEAAAEAGAGASPQSGVPSTVERAKLPHATGPHHPAAARRASNRVTADADGRAHRETAPQPGAPQLGAPQLGAPQLGAPQLGALPHRMTLDPARLEAG